VPEFSTQQGIPDYALLHDGNPLIMVEAKSLKSDLGKAKDKSFQYCWQNKVSFYIWEAHDLTVMGGELIMHVELSRDDIGDAARKMLAL